jgi:hypothetical protein
MGMGTMKQCWFKWGWVNQSQDQYQTGDVQANYWLIRIRFYAMSSKLPTFNNARSWFTERS